MLISCMLELLLTVIIWAPSSEFVSLSILSWQNLTAHAQPFRGARDLAFCLKVLLDSLLVWVSSQGSGETARMHRLAWTFAARIGDKHQIRLTRSISGCWQVKIKHIYEWIMYSIMTHWQGSTLNIKHHEHIKMLLMKWTLVVVDCYGRWLDFQPPLWASWWYYWLLDIDEWWPGGCLAARFLSITLRLIKRHYAPCRKPLPGHLIRDTRGPVPGSKPESRHNGVWRKKLTR